MTDRITPNELRFKRLLPAPIETVWHYIVDPDLRGRWFMGGRFDGRVGGSMVLTMNHQNLSDDDVPMPDKYAQYIGNSWEERIVAIDPPRLLVISWDGGKSGEVTFELSEADGGTNLILTHRGIPDRAGALDFGGGWHSHLTALEARIAGRGVPDFWAIHERSQATIERALA
jgi:uncharacterized protein YndB with AHSA1/START domain